MMYWRDKTVDILHRTTHQLEKQAKFKVKLF